MGWSGTWKKSQKAEKLKLLKGLCFGENRSGEQFYGELAIGWICLFGSDEFKT